MYASLWRILKHMYTDIYIWYAHRCRQKWVAKSWCFHSDFMNPYLSDRQSEPSCESHPKRTDPAGNLFPKNFGFRNLSKVKKDYAPESLGVFWAEETGADGDHRWHWFCPGFPKTNCFFHVLSLIFWWFSRIACCFHLWFMEPVFCRVNHHAGLGNRCSWFMKIPTLDFDTNFCLKFTTCLILRTS